MISFIIVSVMILTCLTAIPLANKYLGKNNSLSSEIEEILEEELPILIKEFDEYKKAANNPIANFEESK